MKCIECGHELKDGAIFCIRCGAMQVSMDGKPIERGEDWPSLDAAEGSGYRSSTEGALHSAQSKNPRGFQPAPKNNGGKIAAIIVAIIAAIALIAFGVVQCNSQATSGSGSAASTTTTTSSATTSSTASTSSTESSTSSTSASASATSASASAASASASAAASGAATQNQQPQQQQAQPQPQPQPQPEPEPEPVYNDYYVLPSSSSYYYSYGELSGMSTYDLFIARNEVFARHGRMFNRADLQDYFNSQAWYNPVYTPAQWESMGNQLNDCELKNVALMKQVEADKGSPYL